MTNTLKNIRENIADSQIERLKKELEQIDEGRFSQSQIDQLKKQFGPLKDKGEKNVVQMDKLAKMMSKYSPDHLLQLSTLDIPMVSKVAKALLAKKDKRFAESLIVGLNKSSAEYKAGKEAAKKGEKYDANPHEPGVKRLNWSTGHNDFRADALRKAGKPNYGARGQFEEVELDEATYRGYEIKRQNRKVDGMKQHPLIIPDLKLTGTNMKDIKRIIDRHLDEEVQLDEFTLSDVKDMARKKWIAEPTPEQMKELQKINHKNNGNITRKDLNDVGVATLGIASEADLTKTQIKMVHDKADELPKDDFIKRYGKDGDSVRYATATNIVKKKLGIEEEITEDTSPEVANVLKKYVTAHPLRWSSRQGVKNRKDFETLQALALKDMTAFRSKFNDMKAKPGEDNYQQTAVRDALAKAGLSKHLTDENKIEGEEIMSESYKDKFNAQMKKAGIDSLDDLKTDAEKKAFFKAVDKSHTADHEEVKEDRGFSSSQIKQAYGVLNDPRYKQGNYSGAVAAIEKIAKGLSNHPDVANALKRANESTNEMFSTRSLGLKDASKRSRAKARKSTDDKLKDWGPVKQMPPLKGAKLGKPVKAGYSEEHDCEHEHPGVSHESWKSKEKKEMKQESKKYHETKPGSIQDTIAKMYVNESKNVTVRVKELSAMIETYLNKGGVSHSLSPAIAEKEISGVLPLQAVREFIGTYNKHFSTNYAAEEFVVEKQTQEGGPPAKDDETGKMGPGSGAHNHGKSSSKSSSSGPTKASWKPLKSTHQSAKIKVKDAKTAKAIMSYINNQGESGSHPAIDADQVTGGSNSGWTGGNIYLDDDEPYSGDKGDAAKLGAAIAKKFGVKVTGE